MKALKIVVVGYALLTVLAYLGRRKMWRQWRALTDEQRAQQIQDVFHPVDVA